MVFLVRRGNSPGKGSSPGEKNIPGRARTCNLRLRRPPLYPIELRGHGWSLAKRSSSQPTETFYRQGSGFPEQDARFFPARRGLQRKRTNPHATPRKRPTRWLRESSASGTRNGEKHRLCPAESLRKVKVRSMRIAPPGSLAEPPVRAKPTGRAFLAVTPGKLLLAWPGAHRPLGLSFLRSLRQAPARKPGPRPVQIPVPVRCQKPGR